MTVVCVVKQSELAVILQRALNTLGPNKMPPWAYQMADALENGDKLVINLIDD